MAARQMWLFNCGWLYMDASLVMYRQGFGQRRKVPVSAALVETDDGYVLFDTGLSPAAATDPDGALGEKAAVLADLDDGHDIRAHLDSLGLSPGDIRWVANSHLHWDHTGGNEFFGASSIVLQESEFRFACSPDPFVSQIYLARQYDLTRDFELVRGDHVICDGVGLVETRGHTPGHQSLIVDLPGTGRVLCTGDALYCRANLDRPWPPGNPWSMPDAYRSIKRLAFLRDFLETRIIIGHEPAEWPDPAARVRRLK